MVRKQFYIEPEQERLLKRLTKELGVSEAELIRRGIDGLEAAMPAASPPVDVGVWREEKAFIDQRMRRFKDVPQTGRTWTREELYEDRLRWPRRPTD